MNRNPLPWLIVAFLVFIMLQSGNQTTVKPSTQITKTTNDLRERLQTQLPVLADQLEQRGDFSEKTALDSFNNLVRQEAFESFKPLMQHIESQVGDGWDKDRWLQTIRTLK